jgi:hypothetical protein
MATEFITRPQVAKYLSSIGLPLGKSMLDKIIWRGEGPPAAGRWGKRDVFRPDEVREWAMKKYLRKSPNGRAA